MLGAARWQAAKLALAIVVQSDLARRRVCVQSAAKDPPA